MLCNNRFAILIKRFFLETTDLQMIELGERDEKIKLRSNPLIFAVFFCLDPAWLNVLILYSLPFSSTDMELVS